MTLILLFVIHSNTWNHLTLLTYIEIELFLHLTVYKQQTIKKKQWLKQKTVLMLNWNVWNFVKPFLSPPPEKMSSGLSKNVIFQIYLEIIYLIYE